MKTEKPNLEIILNTITALTQDQQGKLLGGFTTLSTFSYIDEQQGTNLVSCSEGGTNIHMFTVGRPG